MRLVILESPYAGDIVRNRQYLQDCILDSLRRGEAPLASHRLYTAALDDGNPTERALGIAAGLAWAAVADAVVVYDDYGISPGMAAAIEIHENRNRKIEYRKIRT